MVLASQSNYLYSFTPNAMFADIMDPFNLNKSSGLSFAEQLYTARGSQSVGSSKKVLNDIKEEPWNWNYTARY